MSGHGRCEQRFKNQGYSHCQTRSNAKYEGKVVEEYLTSSRNRWCAFNSKLRWKLKSPSALGNLITAILELLGFPPCKFWEVLVYLSKYLFFLQISSPTSIKKLKNSLELPNHTRSTRKFAIILMTNTSGEINLQSKQDIICHVAKVKRATSAHFVADVRPFLANIIFPSNPTFW